MEKLRVLILKVAISGRHQPFNERNAVTIGPNLP